MLVDLRVEGPLTFIICPQTVPTLESFFLEIIRHPNIQTEAQREIDEVVGDARLPDFGDEQSLPYVTAILKEVLRLNLVAPCGNVAPL